MVHDTKHAEKAHAGFAGSERREAFDDAFWRGRYEREAYFQSGMTWDDYEPAYRFGHDWYHRYPDRKFDDIERDMGGEWDKFKAKSRLKWEHAKHAVRAAWDRAVHGKKDATHH